MTLAELQSLEAAHVMPTYVRNPVDFVRGSGCRLWDDEGNEYLDFLAGISVSSVGHCHPAVVAAIRAQAAALGAYKVMFLTDVAGWFKDADDPNTLIAEASASDLRQALSDVSGGMRPKLAACLHAVEGGVPSAVIVDGRVPHSLLLELFTDEGQGTMIVPDGASSG